MLVNNDFAYFFIWLWSSAYINGLDGLQNKNLWVRRSKNVFRFCVRLCQAEFKNHDYEPNMAEYKNIFYDSQKLGFQTKNSLKQFSKPIVRNRENLLSFALVVTVTFT